MYYPLHKRKSAYLWGLILLATFIIGWHIVWPRIIIYIPLSSGVSGFPVPSFGRKGYVNPDYDVSFSEDGRFVAYTSDANSLNHYDGTSNKGLFLYDAESGKTRTVLTGLWHPLTSIENPQMARDGSHILFLAVDVGFPRKQAQPARLYRYDLATKQTTEIVLPENVLLWQSSELQLSSNGRYIGISKASGAAKGMTVVYDQATGSHGIFAAVPTSFGLVDWATFENRRGNVPQDVSTFINARSYQFYGLTGDLNTAVLELGENHPEANDTNLTYDLYLLDRQTRELQRIPTPNWKPTGFFILLLLSTLVSFYILRTDPADTWRYSTP